MEKKQTLARCHSAWGSHGWRYFSISFHFSEEVPTKISATYEEVKVCYVRLVLVKMVLQLMSQLTCSIKGELEVILAPANIKRDMESRGKKHLLLGTFW